MNPLSHLTSATRVGYISDTHLLAPDVRSATLFPRRLRTLPVEDQSAFYRYVAVEIERAYETCVEEISQVKPDVIVHLGDITSGWEYIGMGHPSVREMAEKVADDLRRFGVPVYACLGNHDVGHPSDREGNQYEAIRAYEAIFHELYWNFKAGDVLSIGACSPLADYRGKDERMFALKKKQEEYLADTLASHSQTPWTLTIHDPLSTRFLSHVLASHMKRCRKIIVGHLHRPSTGPMFRMLGRLPVGLKDFRKALRKVYVAPSTAPLWYQGYGWVLADYVGNRVHLRTIEAMRPEESVPVPTAKLAWCLRGIERH